MSATEGVAFSGTVARITDTLATGGSDASPSNYNGSVDWGDGTTVSAVITRTGAGELFVSPSVSHAYAEEGMYTVTVTISDTDTSSGTGSGIVTVADAPLVSAAGGSPQVFTGAGGTSTSTTPGTANAGLNAFKSAIGGVNNGSTPSERSGGFRTITWDGVKLDGTDFGGETKTISANNVVAVPINRFQDHGVTSESSLAVAGDGFASVNSNAGTSVLPAFSPTQIFAPFNSNSYAFELVTPSLSTTTPTPQATLGLGIVFENVAIPNTTRIDYYDGADVIATAFAPVDVHGPSFVGYLFSTPIVTRVVVTLGTASIFSFDGTTVFPGPSDNPFSRTNLVAADDVAFAEPKPAQTNSLQATAGTQLSGTVATFNDSDANGVASDYTATIDWGDGHRSTGTIAPGSSGEFTVSGANTYGQAGTYPVTIAVSDQGGTATTFHATANVAAGPAPTPPDTTLTARPPATTHSAAVTFAFTSTEPGSTFECQIDAAGFFPCSSPYTTPALADGGHTFAVRAVDSNGNVDPTPATASFTIVTDTTPPLLADFRAAPARFRAKRGTTFHFELSEPATLKLVFDQITSGRRSGRRCNPRARRGARCTIVKPAGTVTALAEAGIDSLAFNGRIGGRALAPGSYRVTVAPTDAAGNAGRSRTAMVTVLR